jgi:hypothetical protein
MSRTKGAKDKTPRRMVNAFQRRQPDGSFSVVLRLYGNKSDLMWFREIGADARGKIVSRVRREIEG